MNESRIKDRGEHVVYIPRGFIDSFLPGRQLIGFYFKDNFLIYTWMTVDLVLPGRQSIGFYLKDN